MTSESKNNFGLDQETFYQKFICWIFLAACFPTFATAQVATVDDFTLAEGFEAELVYSVPDGQGSWVSLTTDHKGRLIACDQYGAIYRITTTGGKADVARLGCESRRGPRPALCLRQFVRDVIWNSKRKTQM